MAVPVKMESVADDKLAVFREISHVIFDVDGLLLDTENLYSKGVQSLLDPYNKTYTMELKCKVMGMPRQEEARIMVEDLDLPMTADEFVTKMQAELVKFMPSAALLPGAESLVKHLHAHGMPLAIASGSTEENHTLKTTNHKALFSVFSHAVFAGSDPDVKRGKPFPDGFLLARDRFKDPPKSSKNVLVFEDAPNGVEAAAAAGMPVVWIPDPVIVKEPLKHPALNKTTLLLDSLEQFNPEWVGLPRIRAK